MSFGKVSQRVKPWLLPAAIVAGVLFHKPMESMQWVVPYLIFSMLLITFCRVKVRDFRINAMIWQLLAIQVVGAVAVFAALRPLNLTFAQSVMICILCPTATAAPVVTGMLGGSIERVASYSIVSNLTVAIGAPLMFVWAGSGANINFVDEIMLIGGRVAPMIALPLGIALALNFIAPPVHAAIARAQALSFYLWAVSLFLVVARAVSFILGEPLNEVPAMVAMAAAAAGVCVLQFVVGRRIGRRYGDPVSAAQGLAQKNTVLAIWMCASYLNPLSSVGPAAYIIWQNIVNSFQIYLKGRAEARK